MMIINQFIEGEIFRRCVFLGIKKGKVCFKCHCNRDFSVTKKQIYSKINAINFDCGCRGCVSKYFNNRLITTAKKGAVKRGLKFDITLDDLDLLYERQVGKCYYSGEKLILSNRYCGKEWISSNISIDRIDSTEGYYIENCVLCTKEIQMMKCNSSLQEIVFLSKCITNYRTSSQEILENILCIDQ